MKTFSSVAKKYARDVIKGKIPACKWVRKACERFESDLKSKRWTFDPKAVESRCKFAELFPHVKGRWAAKRELIKLSPWQVFIYANVWGLKRADGTRKYRRVYIEVPRKNGKSVIGAETGLYQLTQDGEFGAEVYSGATSEKQAWEVFRPARLMALRMPAFVEHYGVEINAKTLAIPEDGSRFEPVIGKPGDGSSPSCAIVDEYHEHKTADLYQTMVTGMGAREQPLLLVITTAGDDIAGPCYEFRDEVCQILDGVYDDASTDDVFGIIYTLDESDDWTTEEALKKANPNLGVSVSADWLRSQQLTAVRKASYQGSFKTKHLNQWVNSVEAFLNVESWLRAGDPSLREEDFVGQACCMGIDLSSRVDFTATVTVYAEEDEQGRIIYTWFPRLYLPEARIRGGDDPKLATWADEGHIIQTPGDEIDFAMVRAEVIQRAQDAGAAEVPFDPWKAVGLEQECIDAGLEMVRFPQTIGHFTDVMNELEAAVLSGRLRHPSNPALNWMASNLQAYRDTNGNCKPRKEKADKKIDGMVAGLMGMSRVMAHVGQSDDVGIVVC